MSTPMVYANVRRVAGPEMTERHIFALLAYDDRPGVIEQFDQQFGDGAASRVLLEVRHAPEVSSLQDQVATMHAQMEALRVQIDTIMAEHAAEPETVEPMPVVAAAPVVFDTSAIERTVDDRMAAMAQTMASMRETLALHQSSVERRLAAAAPKLFNMRVTKRDVNDNIISVEVT